jgi:hypothetical protein
MPASTLYAKIEEAIATEIAQGEYRPGDVSIADAPWRYIRPLLQLGNCPSIRLVGVARSARIWNAGLFGFNG